MASNVDGEVNSQQFVLITPCGADERQFILSPLGLTFFHFSFAAVYIVLAESEWEQNQTKWITG